MFLFVYFEMFLPLKTKWGTFLATCNNKSFDLFLISPRHLHIMKSFAQLSVDNSNVARKAINLHSLIGQQTFERMLTQMELMHNVVDLDRPISIQERANCRDINHTTRALPLRLPAIVLSRAIRIDNTYSSNTARDVVPLSRARCIYEIVIT